MAVLHEILKDSWAHYRNLEVKINKRLKALPAGSVFVRSIGNQKYYYLSIRKNGSSQSRYLGKVRPKEMEEAIRERRLLLKQLKEVRQSLRLLSRSLHRSPRRANSTGLHHQKSLASASIKERVVLAKTRPKNRRG